MPSITLPFDPVIGPILVGAVGRPLSLLGPSATQFPGAGVRFLIDTGASHTCVTPAVAAQAQLQVIGLVAVQSTTHQVTVPTYLADILIPIGQPPFMLRDKQVTQLMLGNPHFDGLFGRDLIGLGQIYINGIARTYTLTF